MNKFAATLCIAGSVLGLAACDTTSSYDSGASYANERTAGEMDGSMNKDAAPVQGEKVFKTYQNK
jgi:hypothetical protein